MAKLVAYVAHPLGAGEDREKNRKNAALWAAYLAEFHNVAPSCNWVVLSGVWAETAKYRDLGIELDKLMVSKCDVVYLTGGRVSPGMQIEADHARSLGIPIRDFTFMGYEAPDPNRNSWNSTAQQIETPLDSTPGKGGPG